MGNIEFRGLDDPIAKSVETVMTLEVGFGVVVDLGVTVVVVVVLQLQSVSVLQNGFLQYP